MTDKHRSIEVDAHELESLLHDLAALRARLVRLVNPEPRLDDEPQLQPREGEPVLW